MPKISFVVFGIQRTGTTLLITLLDSHPDIFCAGEIFKFNPTRVFHGEFRYSNYQDMKIRDFLEYYYKQNDAYAAVGFKLMLNQLKKYPDILTFLKKNKLKVIQVDRENTLKIYISRQIAMKTRLWATGQSVKQNKIYIDSSSLTSELAAINQEKEESTRIASKFDHLRVTYEDLLNKKDETIMKILNFLNVDRNIGLKTGLVKINSDDLKDIVANYGEIHTSLINSSDKRYLH